MSRRGLVSSGFSAAKLLHHHVALFVLLYWLITFYQKKISLLSFPKCGGGCAHKVYLLLLLSTMGKDILINSLEVGSGAKNQDYFQSQIHDLKHMHYWQNFKSVQKLCISDKSISKEDASEESAHSLQRVNTERANQLLCTLFFISYLRDIENLLPPLTPSIGKMDP